MRSESENMRAILNAALAKHQSGSLVQARALYTRILERDPEHADALHFLRLVAHQTGEQAKAADLIRKAIAKKPSVASYHNNLAKVLEEQGDLNAALGAYREARRLDPNDPDSYFNLGVILQKLDRPDEAEAAYRDAVNHGPGDPEYHYNLANLLRERNRLEEALGLYREAIRLRPTFVEAHENLARALFRLNRISETIEASRQVLRLQPDRSEARRLMVAAFDHFVPTKYQPELESDLQACFVAPEVNPQYLARISANQIAHKYRLRARLESDLDALLVDVSTDELLMNVLVKSVNADPMLERLLTALRRNLLFKFYGATDMSVKQVALIVALGLQCFSNEYIFDAQPDEMEVINCLRTSLKQELRNDAVASTALEKKLLLLVMYQPLHELTCATALAEIDLNDWSEPMRPLISRTLMEPLAEQEIECDVESLHAIEDETSHAVRSQYEEHPYPRWLSLPRVDKKVLAAYLSQTFPHFTPPDFLNATTELLVAGCGTGREPISIALGHENTNILAVDLSRRSLAYARRMADKMGVSNVRFLQADILALTDLEQQFHVIECAGVLHHMAQPLRGWQILVDLLVPAGVMKIGLYSELARASVVAAREAIRQKGISLNVSDIKAFRRSVMVGEVDPVIADLTNSEDFYSLSECRDLLFHTHEQRFNLLQIRQALEDLNLTFIGFEFPAPQAKQRYRERFPKDPDLLDLEAWHRFEQLNPQLFAGMYVLWCQKKDSSSRVQAKKEKLV